MFVEIVDRLRCPSRHEDTWLVASATRTEDRDIIEGLLGCPVCRAEYPIRDGVAWFVESNVTRQASEPSAEEAMRLSAFLDLTDPRGVAALVGDWGSHAALVQSLSETHLVLVNPPAGVTVGYGTSGVVVGDVFPFSAGSLGAVAFDESVDASLAASALVAVRGKGRVLAPVRMAVPAGVRER